MKGWKRKRRPMTSERPVFHEDIGEQLRKIREAKDWSVQTAVSTAHALGQPGLSDDTLRRLEAGKIKNPEADVLKAVAKAYGLEYEPLAWRFISANYDIKPSFPVSFVAPALSPEVEAAARALDSVPVTLRNALIEALYTLLRATGTGPRTGRSDAPDRGTIRGRHTKHK